MSSSDRLGKASGSPVMGYFEWLSESMARYEELAKRLLRHNGEKGRAVERVVESALRSILPGRFSLGTGFVINATGESSSQLDLVIYDAFYNSPIVLEGGVGLFPVECVYGFVEVKSVLDGKAVEQIAKAIGAVRRLATEKQYVVYGICEVEPGKPAVAQSHVEDTLPPRAYALALRTDYQQSEDLTAALKIQTETHSAHLHGIAVIDRDWFISQKLHTFPHAFSDVQSQALARFGMTVLNGVQSLRIGPAAMERYLSQHE